MTNPCVALRFNRLLFDQTPIGARVLVGTDSFVIRAHFGGVIDGVLTLTNAHITGVEGDRIDGTLNIVRIPVRNIAFFAVD